MRSALAEASADHDRSVDLRSMRISTSLSSAAASASSSASAISSAASIALRNDGAAWCSVPVIRPPSLLAAIRLETRESYNRIWRLRPEPGKTNP